MSVINLVLSYAYIHVYITDIALSILESKILQKYTQLDS